MIGMTRSDMATEPQLGCPTFKEFHVCILRVKKPTHVAISGLGWGGFYNIAPQLTLTVELHHQGNNEQGHDVDDLDQGVDGRAGCVFVRVAHGIAGHSSLVSL